MCLPTRSLKSKWNSNSIGKNRRHKENKMGFVSDLTTRLAAIVHHEDELAIPPNFTASSLIPSPRPNQLSWKCLYEDITSRASRFADTETCQCLSRHVELCREDTSDKSGRQDPLKRHKDVASQRHLKTFEGIFNLII
jgi:hypothetical protein